MLRARISPYASTLRSTLRRCGGTYSRPLSWDRIDEPLVPERVMQEIEDAVELLQLKGVPKEVASLDLAVCVTPPIEGFNRLLLDAWGTLQGDQHSAQRYREVLDRLCGSGGKGCCSEHHTVR